MPTVATHHPLPPSRGWPRRVRSAAVHAIALADLAFTRTLSWASNSVNPRLRLQAELERLRREISLLREEIRIKDVRMEQLEPHRRPYYPPAARLAILELRAAHGSPSCPTPPVSPFRLRTKHTSPCRLSNLPLRHLPLRFAVSDRSGKEAITPPIYRP